MFVYYFSMWNCSFAFIWSVRICMRNRIRNSCGTVPHDMFFWTMFSALRCKQTSWRQLLTDSFDGRLQFHAFDIACMNMHLFKCIPVYLDFSVVLMHQCQEYLAIILSGIDTFLWYLTVEMFSSPKRGPNTDKFVTGELHSIFRIYMTVWHLLDTLVVEEYICHELISRSNSVGDSS